MSEDKKTFFDRERHDAWTREASRCDTDIHAALEPVFTKWVEMGYSPREVAHIITGAAVSLECEAVMNLRMGRSPFKKR